jgi:hypothetical protein
VKLLTTPDDLGPCQVYCEQLKEEVRRLCGELAETFDVLGLAGVDEPLSLVDAARSRMAELAHTHDLYRSAVEDADELSVTYNRVTRELRQHHAELAPHLDHLCAMYAAGAPRPGGQQVQPPAEAISQPTLRRLVRPIVEAWLTAKAALERREP